MEPLEDAVERLVPEMRRGVLQFAILTLLRERSYGYALCRRLADQGFPIEEGTLYPILRRFEEQGFVASTWDTAGPRPRKYYETTRKGHRVLDELEEAWDDITSSLERILKAARKA